MPTLTLIAEQLLGPVPGGTGRYTAEIGRALAATAPDGWRLDAVTAWHRDTAPARIDGVAGPRRLPVDRRALAELWSRGLPPRVSPDGSVHAPTPLAPARRGAPLVAMVHDAVPWTHPETLTPRGVSWHRRAVGRLVRDADAILAPSQAVAGVLDELFTLGERLHVIPHGYTGLPLPDPAELDAARARLGLPERYVLSVATLEPRKGLDVLVRAFAQAPLARPGDGAAGPVLVLAGQAGWGELSIPRLAEQAGVPPERIRVLGRVSDADLAVAVHGAAAVAVPSRAEGFGLPVLEAMGAGKPVVHSDIEVLNEVAAGAGVAVPVGDHAALAQALAGVLDDADAAQQRAAAGRRRAAEFSWTTAAERTWAVHRSLLPG
ncbi:glycosyltransferase [Nakamurella aerolata]|uniref:Glycosyltransferase family 4 protein n=1 Tax=Nakamurella aerolata TaxID=1656892 RepID=A0A849ACR3_9ACTN|nr:glycosyltransferase family 4 protein [Nakamurella aerolata]